jgi:hypothetical protein
MNVYRAAAFVRKSGWRQSQPYSRKEPPPHAQYLTECPEELQRIVRKCLEKDREQRYQTMRDVALDLDSFVRRQHEAVSVRAHRRVTE